MEDIHPGLGPSQTSGEHFPRPATYCPTVGVQDTIIHLLQRARSNLDSRSSFFNRKMFSRVLITGSRPGFDKNQQQDSVNTFKQPKVLMTLTDGCYVLNNNRKERVPFGVSMKIDLAAL